MRTLALPALLLALLACSCSTDKGVKEASPPEGLVMVVSTTLSTPVPTQTAIPSTPTLVPLPAPAPQTPEPSVEAPFFGWSSNGATSVKSARGGATVQIGVTIRRGLGTPALVLIDVEVYGPDGSKVFQRYFDEASFATSDQRSFTMPWTLPNDAKSGSYMLRIGVFSPGWGTLYHWNKDVATVTVN